jgi:hypothetical protein
MTGCRFRAEMKRETEKRDIPAVFAIPIAAYFDAEYRIIPGASTLPFTDAMTTIDPRPRLREVSGCR